MLIKIVNGAKVKLTIGSDFQIPKVVNYIEIMVYVDDYWILMNKSV